MNFKIISDGSCDLSDELVAEHNIEVIPFYVGSDNGEYRKEKVEFKVEEFYQMMIDKPDFFPKTSMPTTKDYVETFEKYAKDGMPIICVCITSKFSGSYNNACLAKNVILEDYPDEKIEVIDSMVNTCCQGLLVLEIAKMLEAGLSFEETVKKANEIRKTGRIFFTVGGLEYLRHGGRIGKVTGLIGATLKIKPLIVLKEGEIFPMGITFTRKQSKAKVLTSIKKYFESKNYDYHDYEFVVGYGHDKEEGLDLVEKLRNLFNDAKIALAQIGATIGVHTGPLPIGVGLMKKYNC